MRFLARFKKKTATGAKNIADRENFLIAVNDGLAQKWERDGGLQGMRLPERTVFLTMTLEEEVNNGGFSQFFFNSSGDFSGEVADAFVQIGAVKTAEICRRACSAFGRALPKDTEARRALLELIACDEIDEILEACDDAFYEYGEDLAALNYAYIMGHRDAFDA